MLCFTIWLSIKSFPEKKKQALGRWVFVSNQWVFVLDHRVFVLDQWVFVLDHRVFVLDQWVFVLDHRVFGLRSSFLGLRFRHIPTNGAFSVITRGSTKEKDDVCYSRLMFGKTQPSVMAERGRVAVQAFLFVAVQSSPHVLVLVV